MLSSARARKAVVRYTKAKDLHTTARILLYMHSKAHRQVRLVFVNFGVSDQYTAVRRVSPQSWYASYFWASCNCDASCFAYPTSRLPHSFVRCIGMHVQRVAGERLLRPSASLQALADLTCWPFHTARSCRTIKHRLWISCFLKRVITSVWYF